MRIKKWGGGGFRLILYGAVTASKCLDGFESCSGYIRAKMEKRTDKKLAVMSEGKKETKPRG